MLVCALVHLDRRRRSDTKTAMNNRSRTLPSNLRVAVAAAAVAVASLLAACGSSDDAGTAADGGGGKGLEVTTIRYQQISGWVTPLELADELGYLKGLRLKSIGEFQGGPQDLQFVATGQMEIGSSFNGALVKAVQAGAKVKAVVGSYGTDAQRFTGYFVTKNSSVRSARDLIGKKVGMNILGAHYEAILDEWLAREGLSKEEAAKVERVTLPPGYSDQVIRKGLVDAVALSGIVQDEAVARGGIRELFSDHDLYGDFTAGSLVMSPGFMEKNPNTTRALVGGIAKAIRWAQTHSRKEVVDLATAVAKRLNRPNDVKTLAYFKSLGIAQTGGTIAFEDLDRWRRRLESTGAIPKGSVDTNDLFTNDFNPYLSKAAKE